METIKAIAPLLSTIVSFLFLLTGAVAVYTMMVRLGKKEIAHPDAYTKIHRFAGWCFAALFFGMFVYMLTRVAHYNDEFSSRIAIHLTLAIALFFLLVIKVIVPRYFAYFGKNLFMLGISVYLLAFCTVLISGGYHVEKMIAREPYIYHDDFNKKFADDNLGKEFLITKCSTCHVLQNILRPRSEKSWGEVINRMVLLAKPKISMDEAGQILAYLEKNFTSRQIEVPPGASLIEKHCLPCHAAKDIYRTPYSATAWKVIIKKMSELDEKIVPPDKVNAIAEYLVKTQKTNNNAKQPEQ